MAIFSGETCGVCPYGAGFAPTVLPTAAVPVAAEPVDPTMDLEASTDGRGKNDETCMLFGTYMERTWYLFGKRTLICRFTRNNASCEATKQAVAKG